MLASVPESAPGEPELLPLLDPELPPLLEAAPLLEPELLPPSDPLLDPALLPLLEPDPLPPLDPPLLDDDERMPPVSGVDEQAASVPKARTAEDRVTTRDLFMGSSFSRVYAGRGRVTGGSKAEWISERVISVSKIRNNPHPRLDRRATTDRDGDTTAVQTAPHEIAEVTAYTPNHKRRPYLQ